MELYSHGTKLEVNSSNFVPRDMARKIHNRKVIHNEETIKNTKRKLFKVQTVKSISFVMKFEETQRKISIEFEVKESLLLQTKIYVFVTRDTTLFIS